MSRTYLAVVGQGDPSSNTLTIISSGSRAKVDGAIEAWQAGHSVATDDGAEAYVVVVVEPVEVTD